MGLEYKRNVYGGRKFSPDSTIAGKKQLRQISLSLGLSVVINRSLMAVLGLTSESTFRTKSCEMAINGSWVRDKRGLPYKAPGCSHTSNSPWFPN